MKHSEFSMGLEFLAQAGFSWRCTDVGTRTISAIHIDGKDPVWYRGPPYCVEEVVFDEYEMQFCHLTEEDAIRDSMDDMDTSGHPGYPSDDVFRMIHESSEKGQNYPNKSLLRFDRVDSAGEILHPYSGSRDGDSWEVLVYRPFLQTFTYVPEEDFIRLPIAQENDVKRRSMR